MFQPELHEAAAREFARTATSNQPERVRTINGLAMANDAESYGAEGMAELLDGAVRDHSEHWVALLASPLLDVNIGSGIHIALCPASKAPDLPEGSMLCELIEGMRLFRFATFTGEMTNCFVARLVTATELACRRAVLAQRRTVDATEESLWRLVGAAIDVLDRHVSKPDAPQLVMQPYDELRKVFEGRTNPIDLGQVLDEHGGLGRCMRLIFVVTLLLGFKPSDIMIEVEQVQVIIAG